MTTIKSATYIYSGSRYNIYKKEAPVFNEILLGVKAYHLVNQYLNKTGPVVLALEGAPGTGKTTFARKLANFAHMYSKLFFVDILQMDWGLKYDNLPRSDEQILKLDTNYYSNSYYWYDLPLLRGKLEKICRLKSGKTLVLNFPYRNINRQFNFPENKIGLLLLEGAYSLHNEFFENIDCNLLIDGGIFLFTNELNRSMQFFTRHLSKEHSIIEPAPKRDPHLLSRRYSYCYAKYLKTAIWGEGISYFIRLAERNSPSIENETGINKGQFLYSLSNRMLKSIAGDQRFK